LIFFCVSASILLLCSGAHQFGVRLENGEVADGLGDGLDGLHAGKRRSRSPPPVGREVDRLMRPSSGVKGLALNVSTPSIRGRVGVESGPMAVIRKRVRKRCRAASAMFSAARILVKDGSSDLAAELDVAAQVELVGDEIEVAQRFRLAGEMLGPVPFLQQLLEKE